MQVKVFANLAETVGQRAIDIPLDDEATVGEVLERLFERYPSLREDVLDDAGLPADHINFLVNGSAVERGEQGLAHPLTNEDELAIFPPVTGGSSISGPDASLVRIKSVGNGGRTEPPSPYQREVRCPHDPPNRRPE